MTSSSDAEFVFRGVIRPDAYGPAADAVAVRDGRVIALGAEDCAATAGPSTVVINVDGVVVPGFIDAHVHPVIGGLELTRCDLSDLHDLGDYRGRIRDRAAATDGEWVLGAGWYGGTLRVGMAADLAVLDADPLEVAPSDLSAIRVTATYVAGLPVHTA